MEGKMHAFFGAQGSEYRLAVRYDIKAVGYPISDNANASAENMVIRVSQDRKSFKAKKRM